MSEQKPYPMHYLELNLSDLMILKMVLEDSIKHSTKDSLVKRKKYLIELIEKNEKDYIDNLENKI